MASSAQMSYSGQYSTTHTLNIRDFLLDGEDTSGVSNVLKQIMNKHVNSYILILL